MAPAKKVGRFGAFGLSVRLSGEAQRLEALANELQGQFMSNGLDAEHVGALVGELRSRLQDADELLGRLAKRVGCAATGGTGPQGRSSDRARVDGFRGSSNTVPVSDLLGLLSAQRQTGTLRIQAGKVRFLLEFQDGAVVHAATDFPEPERRLGTILVSRGSISAERLDAFLKQHEPGGEPLGAALARASLIDEDDLVDALGVQVHDLVLQVLELGDCSFHFQGGAVQDLEFRVSLNTTQLLLEAARVRDESRV